MDSRERIAEELLVIRAQMGDRSAFAGLFERYDARLRYLMRRLLSGREAAEGAAQDVWLTVLSRIRSLRSPGAFRAWFYRIARNRAYQELRSHEDVDLSVEEPIEPGPEPPDAAVAAEDAARIQIALGSLQPKHREVLVLCYVEQMPYEETAEVLEVPLGTVKSRIYYAKSALRREMEGRSNEGHKEPGR